MKLYKTKEAATMINVNEKTLLKYGKKYLTNKKIENGKPTYWHEEELKIIADRIFPFPKFAYKEKAGDFPIPVSTAITKFTSTKELAETLNTSPKVVLENAKKCLPNKKIENGKPTYWTKEEVDILIEQLKCNQPNGKTFPNLLVELKGLKRCERDSSITTMQFAKQLGTSPNVILENARKCLPEKRIENGKQTFWTKAEITVILDYMKSHTSNNRSIELNSAVANTTTELTPALKLKKALDLAQEAYEEELARINAEKENLQIQLDESKEWYSVKRIQKLNPDVCIHWRMLKRESERLGFETKKVFDQNYGEVNAYHRAVYESLYFDTLEY